MKALGKLAILLPLSLVACGAAAPAPVAHVAAAPNPHAAAAPNPHASSPPKNPVPRRDPLAMAALGIAPPHARVLIVGAGTGEVARELRAAGLSVTVAEADPLKRRRLDDVVAWPEDIAAMPLPAFDVAVLDGEGIDEESGRLPRVEDQDVLTDSRAVVTRSVTNAPNLVPPEADYQVVRPVEGGYEHLVVVPWDEVELIQRPAIFTPFGYAPADYTLRFGVDGTVRVAGRIRATESGAILEVRADSMFTKGARIRLPSASPLAQRALTDETASLGELFGEPGGTPAGAGSWALIEGTPRPAPWEPGALSQTYAMDGLRILGMVRPSDWAQHKASYDAALRHAIDAATAGNLAAVMALAEGEENDLAGWLGPLVDEAPGLFGLHRLVRNLHAAARLNDLGARYEALFLEGPAGFGAGGLVADLADAITTGAKAGLKAKMEHARCEREPALRRAARVFVRTHQSSGGFREAYERFCPRGY